MRTSIGGRILLPVRPENVAGGDKQELQRMRDDYMERRLAVNQEASALRRRLSRVEHEANRLDRNIKNIDTLCESKGIELQKELRD